MAEYAMVPPDGGWGWIIVLAYALNSIIFIPIMQCFGLIFKDTFDLMGFSATDGAIILNTNASVSMLTGLINGPLLKSYGFRRVSYLSVVLLFLGLFTTAYANSFTTLFITYGLITSLGMGMGMSSYPLALNSYFKKNRGKATGFAMTITGLGPILMPQFISFLMSNYVIQHVMLIMSALCLHSFISASLLQPVKWHLKKEIIDNDANGNATLENGTKDVQINLENPKNNLLTQENDMRTLKKRNSIYNSTLSIDDDEVQTIYGYDTPLTGSVLSLYTGTKNRKYSVSSFKSAISDKQSSPMKTFGGQNEKYSSLLHDIDKELPEESDELMQSTEKMDVTKSKEKVYNPEMTVNKPEQRRKTVMKKMLKNIVNIFDLTLFKDPIYINIMIGMSLAIFAELNFSLLTPFILRDLTLNTSQTATFLSTLSVADLCFRFLAPFIGDYLNQPPRIMYCISLIMLIITRFSILMVDGYSQLIYVAVALGIAKGVRTVYMSLVIPSYVPIERLANASGLQMVVNGLFILIGGPLLGIIRDATGSYAKCIYVINLVTITTILLWTLESIYIYFKRRNKQLAMISGKPPI